jgi:L,D-transpeptidase catalytic domain
LSLIVRLASALAAVVVIGLLWTGLGGSNRQGQTTAAIESLPPAPVPALQIGRPERLLPGRYLSRWTVVLAESVARTEPAATSPVVATLATTTPDQTPNVLAVLGTRTVADGQLWIKVRLPVLPNGTVGWVPRRSLGAYQTVNTQLVVDRQRLLANLYQNGKVTFTAPVGVGTDSWPTPAGQFTIRSELTRYASPFYGPVAFGTTARSAILTDWPGGGFVGIHGTNEPQLIPGRISHGCIRMRNADIVRLAALMPIGTPLTIR